MFKVCLKFGEKRCFSFVSDTTNVSDTTPYLEFTQPINIQDEPFFKSKVQIHFEKYMVNTMGMKQAQFLNSNLHCLSINSHLNWLPFVWLSGACQVRLILDNLGN